MCPGLFFSMEAKWSGTAHACIIELPLFLKQGSLMQSAY